jgi:hypothetical protein
MGPQLRFVFESLLARGMHTVEPQGGNLVVRFQMIAEYGFDVKPFSTTYYRACERSLSSMCPNVILK